MFKYLTDCPAPNYPVAGFFARDPEYGIAIFSHGPKGVKRIPQYASVEQLRDNVAVPYVPSVFYTDNYIAEEAVAIAKRNGYKKIGFYNQNIIPSALSQHLKENLPGVEFTDASELLDNIKAVKSDYEIKLWTKAVEIHDHLMAAVPSILRPGRYEKEISDDIFYFARSFDCEASNIMIGSDPKKPIRNLLIFQNKRIEAGDVIQLLIEVSGPTDLWAECGRMFSLGDPCKEVLKAFDDAVVMQDWTMKQCVPGANPEAIYIEYNKSLEEMGYQPEKRIFAHGQTYDIVDRPVFWEGETMKLKKNMFVALHPVLTNKETSGYICDNFVIGEKGALRLSKTSRELFVL
jgi:Xaa-Pro aminopeptidase